MKRILPMALFLAIPLLMPAAPALAAPPSSLYSLVWSDEFDGTSVDTAKWNFRTDAKRESAQRPENISVAGGLMSIALKKEAFNGKEYTGGGLISKKSFRYGYYEASARITTAGSGWHPAFWAMAGDGTTTAPANRRTEIDGFEFDMHAPRNIHHNAHGWKADGTKVSIGRAYDVGFDPRAGFHTYGFAWSESNVKFYVDGVVKHTSNYSPTCCTQHDYINIWLTTIAVNLAGIDDTKLPGQVQFDYVRYYQNGNYTDNDGPTASRYSETGAWSTSSVAGHTLENTSRYSASAGATATWDGWLPAAGTYDVYLYKIANPNSDSNSRVDVTHNSGTATSYLNYATGASGWIKLGTWTFSSGFNGSVKITGSGAGLVRADAVRWSRVA
jgi:beta-glucanase (GH16 family)